MSAASVLAVRGLRAGYRRADGTRHEVLGGVELSVGSGERVAVLGPNGSGKTTLLRCLAGTITPWSGSIDLFGRPIQAWSRTDLARRVAVLPQSLELPDGFRVAELVGMARLPHATRPFASTAADSDAVERALTDADALELAERQAAELSGGERQRVLVAMALAQEPGLLLLDEPTVHLDVAHQLALLDAIERVGRRRSLTVIAVLHDLNLAIASAPRLLLLSGGGVVADGAPQAVLDPEVVRRLYGRQLDPAWTADGRRFLVPRRTAPARPATGADEPFGNRVGTV